MRYGCLLQGLVEAYICSYVEQCSKWLLIGPPAKSLSPAQILLRHISFDCDDQLIEHIPHFIKHSVIPQLSKSVLSGQICLLTDDRHNARDTKVTRSSEQHEQDGAADETCSSSDNDCSINPLADRQALAIFQTFNSRLGIQTPQQLGLHSQLWRGCQPACHDHKNSAPDNTGKDQHGNDASGWKQPYESCWSPGQCYRKNQSTQGPARSSMQQELR
mmetsp:Transcript_46279/g.82190  ORF Transcript_46279/g.82190 Transcript_46279/m.82190 type:complete len:217 (-) Transcript_46279:1426-2076(-)